MVLNSCKTSEERKVATTKKFFNSFFDVQKESAEVLDKYAGGPKLTIVPINGMIYPIGTVLKQGTNNPITNKCTFSDGEINKVPMAKQPSLESSRNFNAKAKMPSFVEKALGGFFGLAAGVEKSEKMTLNYEDLSSSIVYEDVMDAKLISSECLNKEIIYLSIIINWFIFGKNGKLIYYLSKPTVLRYLILYIE